VLACLAQPFIQTVSGRKLLHFVVRPDVEMGSEIVSPGVV
jgi:hypothetical protein